MDFYWTSYFNSFWIFPLLCFLFMVVMMLACGGMLLRRHGHQYRDAGDTARRILDRRYATGEIAKEQYEAGP